ncbi:MAG: DNA primase [candidate division Zixibacteria bacterium]|nr:DNA primase [candidate division Zixibacteria bacterium]
MIPQETIEQVREATDIVQIAGEYVRLKKKGRDMWACCPFHTEKSPSFKVSADRQLFHCFGCGKGGNVFTFLMEHEGMSFVEAVRYLAERAGIPIRETRSDHQHDELERLNYAHEIAVEYYRQQLKSTTYKVVLENYLQNKRGINLDSIEQFNLGLAGESWDGLLKYAATKDIKPEEMVRAGLAGRSEQRGTYYDRFRQRLMIPIYNLTHKPIAFGGRTLKKGEPAKYVNSPETPLYSKSRVLYGLNLARDHIRKENSVYVVEGYFDVISLFQCGIKNVVASSGTSFTSPQAHLLARFAEQVYLFFDADSAGRQAALRSVDSLYDAGLEVKVITAPSGEDPDSIARKQGPEQIEELRAAALPYLDFRVQQTDLIQDGIIGREKLVKELTSLASRISDPTRRDLFLQATAEKLGVNQSVLHVAGAGSPEPNRSTGPTGSQFQAHEFELLSLLLLKPGVVDFVFDAIASDDFDSPLLSRIYDALKTQYKATGDFDIHRLIEDSSTDPMAATVSELAAKDWTTDSIDYEIKTVVGEFVRRRQAAIRDRLKQAIRQAEADGDQDHADELIEDMKQYGL